MLGRMVAVVLACSVHRGGGSVGRIFLRSAPGGLDTANASISPTPATAADF